MKKTTRFLLISVYYLIAVIFSMFFRVKQLNPDWYIHLLSFRYGWILFRLLRGVGPLIGGIFGILVFRNKYQRSITIKGVSLLVSTIYYLAPVLMTGLVGVAAINGENPHMMGLLSGILIIVYCLFEETGWRGYLNDVMRGFSSPLRYILIGILWYLWHLNFTSSGGGSLKFGLLIHLPSCILGSWVIGQISDKYKSIMVAAAIHSIFNIFFDLEAGLNSKIIIVAGVLIIWITTSFFLDKRLAVVSSESKEP